MNLCDSELHQWSMAPLFLTLRGGGLVDHWFNHQWGVSILPIKKAQSILVQMVHSPLVGSIPTLRVLTSSFFGYVLAQGEKDEKKGWWEGNSN